MAYNKNLILLLSVSCFLVKCTYAGNIRYSGSELSAYSLALSGAGVAVVNSSSVLGMNQAVNAYCDNSRLSLFYSNRFSEVHNMYSEFSVPFSHFASLAAAVFFSYSGSDEHSQVYSGSMALRLFRGLAVGGEAEALVDTNDGNYGEAYRFNAALHLAPYDGLGFGFRADNLNEPVMEYSNNSSSTSFPMSFTAGLSLEKKGYFLFSSDYSFGLDPADTEGFFAYGIEIFPLSALSLRGGIADGEWSCGAGLKSGQYNIDYAYSPAESSRFHSFQVNFKLGRTPSRIEQELAMKESELNRKEDYLDALRDYNRGDYMSAIKDIEEYRNKYGSDHLIEELDRDLDEMLDKIRKEKIGRAHELKREILVDFYNGNYNKANIKLNNLKILAPNYDQIEYLEHVFRANELIENGSFEEAEIELIEAMKMDPDSREVKTMYHRMKEVIRLSE
jgi:hypothetical protein